MNVSTRFTVALHILTLLASSRGEPLTSEYIALSVNTNPVVVRRLLGFLKKQGLVSSQPGTGGGWGLSVAPGSITLLDVRRAVIEGSPFTMHNQTPNPACPVGRNIQGVLGALYEKAEQAMEDELTRTSIQGLLNLVQAKQQN
jgi:Rrf2 family protein